MAESETRKIDHARRELARCKKCKVGYQRTVRIVGTHTTTWGITGMRSHSHTTTYAEDGQPLSSKPAPVCPGCGKPLRFSPVKGRVVPEIKCGAKCQGATGPNCECACGGKNHGGACAAV